MTTTSVPATGPRDRSPRLLARSTAAAKCCLCTVRDTYSGRSCDDCLNELAQSLRQLGAYWALLPLMTGPTRGQAGRMSPGYGSRPVARLDVLAALDPKTVPTEEDDVWSIPGTVDRVADWIAVIRGEPTGQGLWYVHKQLRWVAGQPEFETVAEALHEIHRRAQHLAGDRPQRPLGKCLVVTCEAPVFWGGPGKAASCSRCSRSYDGLDLVRLGAQEAAA